ncbi:MAG: hypothetical protein H6704_04455 [Myxococcales bacterium]|nr:hypothetical protein [Myxococcales bacterium]
MNPDASSKLDALAAELRDVPAPLPVTDWATVAWTAAAIALALVALVFVARVLRRRGRRPVSPEAAARAALAAAEADALAGDLPAWGAHVATAVRVLLSARAGVAADRRTSDELLAALREQPSWRDRVPTLARIFDACDRARFGAALLPRDERAQVHAAAVELLQAPTESPA